MTRTASPRAAQGARAARRSHRGSRSCLAAFTVLGAVSLLLGVVPASAGTVTRGGLGVPHKLNLVVTSDYDIESPDDLKPVFTEGSRTLYDATEKQMQLGTVTFYNNCPTMRDRADVLIVEGSERMRAATKLTNTKPAFKMPGYHIEMGEKRLEKAAPGRSLAHELGHYAFNLRDEYSKLGDTEKGHIQTRSEDPFLPFVDFDQAYCNEPHYTGTTSLMVVGPNIPTPTEFCTKSGQGWGTDHHEGHVFTRTFMDLSSLDPSTAGQVSKTWFVMVNDQQHAKQRSTWEQVALMSTLHLGAPMIHPLSEPVSGDTAGHQAIEWKVEPCASTIIFVIDRSGSMSNDARLAWAKSQANNSIDLLEDGTQVGAVSFSDSAATLFEIAPLSSDNRPTMHQQIQGLASGGGTNIGGGLLGALSMLRARDPRDGAEAIVLLTDGEHTTGTPPEQVEPELVAEGITVQIVGLGNDVDVSSLSQLSENTGGRALFVSGTSDQAPALTELALESHGNKPIATWRGTLQAGESLEHPLWVDEFTSQVVFFLSTPLYAGTLELRDPSGAAVDQSAADVDLLLDAEGQTLRVHSPAVGNWTLTATAPQSALLGAPYRLVAYDRSTQVNVVSGISGGILGSTVVAVPEPIQLHTRVFGGGGMVAGAEVAAEVTHPDGRVSTVPMHDDGRAEHGDTMADDGIYNARFFQYGPAGTHDVVIHVAALDGRTATRGHTDHDPSEIPSQPVARFERTNELSAFVFGLPGLLTPGTVEIDEAAGTPVPGGRAVPAGAPNVPMASLRVVVDSKEYVVLSSAGFEDVGEGDLAEVAAVKLYLDGDEDGYPDRVGEWTEPIAEATIDPSSRTITFQDVPLPPDGEHDLLITYDFAGSLDAARMALGGDEESAGPTRQRPDSRTVELATAPVERAPAKSGSVAVLVLLSLAAAAVARQLRRGRSRRLARPFAIAAVSGLLVAGTACSGDDGESLAAPDAPPGEAVVVPTSISNYQVLVGSVDWSATGATTGEQVPVTGASITGPSLTVARFDSR